MSADKLIEKFKDLALPEAFKSSYLKDLLDIDGVVLAGGSIRDTLMNEIPKDYDIFFTSQEALDKAREFLSKKMDKIAETAYTQTFREEIYEVQLVFKKIYDNKKQIISDFDFTPTMFAIDNQGIAVGPTSLEDVSGKICRVNVITKPLSSLNRLVKYQDMKYDTKDAYYYILSVMKTQPHGIILGGESSFYNDASDNDPK